MAERPKNTYISQVINPGIDKKIPTGVVNVVYARNGEAVGYMRDGQYVELGQQPSNKKTEKKTSQTKNRGQYLDDLDTKLITAQDAVNAARFDIQSSEPESQEFKAATNALDVAQSNYQSLQKQYNDFVKQEASTKLQSKLQKLETEKKRKTALNESTAKIEADIKKTKENVSATSTISTEERRPSLAGVSMGEADTTIPAVKISNKTKLTPKKKAETPPKPGKTKPANIDEIFALVQSQYGPVDAIFKEDSDLKALMIRAVGDPKNPTDDYDPQRFLNELQTTTWWAKNSGPIRQRQFYKKQYEDLLKKGGNAEELAKTTEYGRGLGETKQIIADEAVRRGAALDATDLDMLATQVYDLANETKGSIIAASVRGKIKYTPGAALGGAAGVSLADLQKTASANGLDLNKQFGSSVQGWLQKISQGESPETYKQIIRDTAKIGLPNRVASLVDKGIDLETIYNPYKNMMAATLEINPETIKLNDPTLRMAIGPEKEMSLYDYQRSLRKDARWQYTDNARQEVSSLTSRILKDFGFQG